MKRDPSLVGLLMIVAGLLAGLLPATVLAQVPDTGAANAQTAIILNGAGNVIIGVGLIVVALGQRRLRARIDRLEAGR